MADAGLKPTPKVCKNCTAFGNYDEMTSLLIVRIITTPKRNWIATCILSTTQAHFGFITSPESGNANFL